LQVCPDEAAPTELIERFLPLARALARRYGSDEDLVQVASLGLVKAIDRFDPARGCEFAGFAVPCILGELKRHRRDFGWAVHLPRGLQERVLLVERTAERLASAQGRPATVAAIAAASGLDPDGVLEALEAAANVRSASLDSPGAGGCEDGEPLAESVGVEDDGYEFVEAVASAAPAVAALPERERTVLNLHFVEDLNQREIGARVGLSQVHVSRLIRRALDQLQRECEPEPAGALRPPAGFSAPRPTGVGCGG